MTASWHLLDENPPFAEWYVPAMTEDRPFAAQVESDCSEGANMLAMPPRRFAFLQSVTIVRVQTISFHCILDSYGHSEGVFESRSGFARLQPLQEK